MTMTSTLLLLLLLITTMTSRTEARAMVSHVHRCKGYYNIVLVLIASIANTFFRKKFLNNSGHVTQSIL